MAPTLWTDSFPPIAAIEPVLPDPQYPAEPVGFKEVFAADSQVIDAAHHPIVPFTHLRFQQVAALCNFLAPVPCPPGCPPPRPADVPMSVLHAPTSETVVCNGSLVSHDAHCAKIIAEVCCGEQATILWHPLGIQTAPNIANIGRLSTRHPCCGGPKPGRTPGSLCVAAQSPCPSHQVSAMHTVLSTICHTTHISFTLQNCPWCQTLPLHSGDAVTPVLQ